MLLAKVNREKAARWTSPHIKAEIDQLKFGLAWYDTASEFICDISPPDDETATALLDKLEKMEKARSRAQSDVTYLDKLLASRNDYDEEKGEKVTVCCPNCAEDFELQLW